MTVLQKVRLQIETRPIYVPILPVIMVSLFLALFLTENDVFLYLLATISFLAVSFLFFISRKTDNWWYNEYDDNKWGRSRQLMQALKAIRASVASSKEGAK